MSASRLRSAALPVGVLALLAAQGAAAAVTYLGVTSLSGSDKSHLDGLLEDGVTPAATIGGLSAIAWTGHDDLYYLLPDRGPNFYHYAGGELVDRTQSFINRVQVVRIVVAQDHDHDHDHDQNPARGWRVAATLTATMLLSSATPLTGSVVGNPGRRYFTGLSSGIDARVPANSMRLDSEGLRIGSDGRRFYVSDEYGPFIHEFDMNSGQRLRSILMPKDFLPAHPAATGAAELAGNQSGRQPNKGMEGLAITPDGSALVGLMQSPLLQDQIAEPDDSNPGSKPGKKPGKGTNTRLLRIDLRHCSSGTLANCPTLQHVYQQDTPATANSEILAVNDHEFLTIERDGRPGDESVKRIYLVDTVGATDVSTVAQLPRAGLPPGVTAVSKRLLFDLAASLKAAGEPVVEKYEGLAFGPDLPDGRHLLLVTVDNDFVHEAPSSIYAFAVDAADLPGFKAQQFSAVRH